MGKIGCASLEFEKNHILKLLPVSPVKRREKARWAPTLIK